MYHQRLVTALSLLLVAGLANGLRNFVTGNPHFVPGRQGIVQLFEWKWKDIANECERYLGPKGFGGVQTSPVTENMVLPERPGWERYQPVSYRWLTRSGNEEEFKDMVTRCNRVGVRIYVDLVLNHMTKNRDRATGTGGSSAFPNILFYPDVPYTSTDFNPPCETVNMSDVNQLRNCYILGYDLDQSNEHVRRTIVVLMNKLIAAGVAGFRIVHASLMWPEDLREIYSRVRSLEMDHGFPNYARPYVYQDMGLTLHPTHMKFEYSPCGLVTENFYPVVVGNAFAGKISLGKLKDFMKWPGLLPSDNAIVYIDNPTNQRHPTRPFLSYKSSKLYKMAVAFMLAYPYGNPVIMSSYAFDTANQGPPSDGNEDVISPIIKDDGSCDGGWICEHRWHQISNMIAFRNTVGDTTVNDWWANDSNQIAFSRGDQGFIAINGNDTNLVEKIQTRLSPGIYCDVISGDLINGKCSGKMVIVDESGKAEVEICVEDEDGVVAIHRNAKLRGL